MIAFGHFFDLESAHEGIFCRNIATIPQENNRCEDNFDDFSKILTRDGCCVVATSLAVICDRAMPIWKWKFPRR